jgi:hypothetical protein
MVYPHIFAWRAFVLFATLFRRLQIVACGPGLLRAWRPLGDGSLRETPLLHPRRESPEVFTDMCWFRDKTSSSALNGGGSGGGSDPYGAKRIRERRIAVLTSSGSVLIIARTDVETHADAAAVQKQALMSGSTDKTVVLSGTIERSGPTSATGGGKGGSGASGPAAGGGSSTGTSGGSALPGASDGGGSVAGEMWEIRATIPVQVP